MKKTREKMSVGQFLYRLWFTRDDDLDALQMLFTLIIIVALIVVWNIALNGDAESVKIEGLVTLRWLAGLLVITAVPKWLVPLISNHTKGLAAQANTEETPESFEHHDSRYC